MEEQAVEPWAGMGLEAPEPSGTWYLHSLIRVHLRNGSSGAHAFQHVKAREPACQHRIHRLWGFRRNRRDLPQLAITGSRMR